MSGEDLPPEDVVMLAKENNCESIAYTYTEPTIFFEYTYGTSILAKKEGIADLYVTNGFYGEICGARLKPVLNSLRLMKKLGIWVEVTTLVIPTLNDSMDELRQIAEFIKNEQGNEAPWHISRFYPSYRFKEPASDRYRDGSQSQGDWPGYGSKICLRRNIPGDIGENTYCYNCNEVLIKRYPFTVYENRIEDSKCPNCGAKIDGRL